MSRIAYRLRRLTGPESLRARCWQTLLFRVSEWQSTALRPGSRSIARELYLRSKGVEFGRPGSISSGFTLYKTPTTPLKIGPRFCIGENAGIYVHDRIEIGSDFLAAPGITINNGSHELETLKPTWVPITIGDRVWCGVNVTIVHGAEIGSDCVIGANSLVMSKIPDRCLAVGTPAKVIRRNIRSENRSNLWTPFPDS